MSLIVGGITVMNNGREIKSFTTYGDVKNPQEENSSSMGLMQISRRHGKSFGHVLFSKLLREQKLKEMREKYWGSNAQEISRNFIRMHK